MFVYQFSQAGLAHGMVGRGNEDACAVRQAGDDAFVFMADGMGSARLGGQAARAAVDVASALAPWTCVRTAELAASSRSFAVRAAFPIAYNALLDAAGKNGWDTRDMLTTFMCAAFGARDGRLEYGFCGDGGILALTNSGQIRLLTSPAKGMLAGQTTPLHSCADWRFGSCEDVRAFLMCTDGVFNQLCPGGTAPKSLRLRRLVKRLLKMPGRVEAGQLRAALDNAFSSELPTVDDLGRLMEGVTDDRSIVIVSAVKKA